MGRLHNTSDRDAIGSLPLPIAMSWPNGFIYGTKSWGWSPHQGADPQGGDPFLPDEPLSTLEVDNAKTQLPSFLAPVPLRDYRVKGHPFQRQVAGVAPLME
jgi:hypothetical protein